MFAVVNLILTFVSAAQALSLISSVDPPASSIKLFLRLSVWIDELFDTKEGNISSNLITKTLPNSALIIANSLTSLLLITLFDNLTIQINSFYCKALARITRPIIWSIKQVQIQNDEELFTLENSFLGSCLLYHYFTFFGNIPIDIY